MNHFIYESPIGPLCFVEDQGSLVEISFKENHFSDNKKTSLIEETILQMEDYFKGKRFSFDLPYQLKGTPFQLKVWEALRHIPYGKVVSYKDIAIVIGNPKASQAVGQAIHKNPLAILIPCHRVIGSNKKLVGYAYGLDKKEYLLKIEKNELARFLHFLSFF